MFIVLLYCLSLCSLSINNARLRQPLVRVHWLQQPVRPACWSTHGRPTPLRLPPHSSSCTWLYGSLTDVQSGSGLRVLFEDLTRIVVIVWPDKLCSVN